MLPPSGRRNQLCFDFQKTNSGLPPLPPTLIDIKIENFAEKTASAVSRICKVLNKFIICNEMIKLIKLVVFYFTENSIFFYKNYN